jgi:hypothetical protein
MNEKIIVKPIGRSEPYSECCICQKVANKKPSIEVNEIERFEKLIKVQIGTGSHFLCRGCKQKLVDLLNQY